MCSLHFICGIEFTMKHVHYNVSIVHGVHLHLNTTCWFCLQLGPIGPTLFFILMLFGK